mgnify:FL=1
MDREIITDTSPISFFRRPRNGINVDISFRCPLECMRCQRQTNFTFHGRKVYGKDATMDEVKKLAAHFTQLNFCGQLSDPVHHPKFPEILEYLYKNGNEASIHNASSAKSEKFYIKCFEAHPDAKWIFGIDGMPEESSMYRVNQDGEKLFKIMLKSKEYLTKSPSWQYIVFSYNEHNIQKAKDLAKKHGLMMIMLHSSRWMAESDPLRPKSTEYNLQFQGYTRDE